MEESCLYEELTPRKLRKRLHQAPIAYLPLGTLEWHGEHLPLGSDGLQSRGFFERLAAKAGGVVLPMLFVGPDKRILHDGAEFFGMDIYGFSEDRPRRLPAAHILAKSVGARS